METASVMQTAQNVGEILRMIATEASKFFFNLSPLFSDVIWYSAFQLTLVSITAYAFLRMNVFTESSAVSGVSRGEESRSFLPQVAPAALTLVVSVIAAISTFPTDDKVFFYLFDVVQILYLTLWNGWSTNKLIGLLVKFKVANYNPHH